MAIRIDYELGASGLIVTTSVRNESARTAPFGLGFHPYLAAGEGLVDDLTLTVPASTRLQLEGGIPTGREPVDGSVYDFRAGRRIGAAQLDDAFTGLETEGGVTRIRAGLTSLRASEGFDYLQVFTGDTLAPKVRRRGLAVEPMTCPPNALATGEGLVHLEPDERMELVWGITPG